LDAYLPNLAVCLFDVICISNGDRNDARYVDSSTALKYPDGSGGTPEGWQDQTVGKCIRSNSSTRRFREAMVLFGATLGEAPED
jgi:hypothetical protein